MDLQQPNSQLFQRSHTDAEADHSLCVRMAGDFLGSCLFNFLATGCTILLLTALPIAQITLGAVYTNECPVAPVIPVYVMVCGILALLVIGMFALPKLLCPAAPTNKVCILGFLSLGLVAVVWFLYGSYLVYSVYPPNYNKNLNDTNRINSSIYSPAGLDNKLALTLDNQNQNPPDLSHTRVNMVNNNQSLLKIIHNLTLSDINSKTSGERLNAPRIVAPVSYCDRTVYLFAFWMTTLTYVVIGVSLFIILGLYVLTKLLFLVVGHN